MQTLWTNAIRLSQAYDGSATILLYNIHGKMFLFHFAANEDAEPQIKKQRFWSSCCASSSHNFEFVIVNQSKGVSSNQVVAFISVASRLSLWILGFGLECVSLLLSLVPFSFS
jgi:hypothetical protein